MILHTADGLQQPHMIHVFEGQRYQVKLLRVCCAQSWQECLLTTQITQKQRDQRAMTVL